MTQRWRLHWTDALFAFVVLLGTAIIAWAILR